MAYHKLIKDYLDNNLFLFELKDKYIENINKCPYKFPKFKYADLNEQIYNSIIKHLDTFHFFERYQILEYENRYHLDFCNYPFVMIPDMVCYNEQKEFILLDHKISAIWKKSDMQKKKRQLYVYAYAIEKKYNKLPDKFEVNFYKDNQIVKYDFIHEELDETKKWVENQIEAILKETEFIPRCLQIKDPKKDFYAIWLCSHRNDCRYRPFKSEIISESNNELSTILR